MRFSGCARVYSPPMSLNYPCTFNFLLSVFHIVLSKLIMTQFLSNSKAYLMYKNKPRHFFANSPWRKNKENKNKNAIFMCHIHIKKIQIAFSLITKNKWYCKHVNDYCIVNSLWYWPLFPWFNVLWNCKTFTYELAYKHKLISIQQRNLERYTCVKVVLLIVLRTLNGWDLRGMCSTWPAGITHIFMLPVSFHLFLPLYFQPHIPCTCCETTCQVWNITSSSLIIYRCPESSEQTEFSSDNKITSISVTFIAREESSLISHYHLLLRSSL